MGIANGFGGVVQRYRERAGLTQEELAATLGVSQQTVGKWESGAAFPRPAMFAQLNELLHIPAGEIVHLYGPSKGARSPAGLLGLAAHKQPGNQAANELLMAELIITSMYSLLTDAQREALAAQLTVIGVAGENPLRSSERRAAITSAVAA